jgi:hypothetical protein
MICAERKEERTSGAKALVSLVRYGTAEAVPFVESIFPSEHGARRAGVETADLSTVLRSVENISTKGPRNCRSLHGSPGQVGFAPNEQKINPTESISISSVHFTLNLLQASQLLGMTKERVTVP